jgi:lipid-A-disaccharide synthase-like uncharacterized protein
VIPETSPRLVPWHRRAVIALGIALALTGLLWMVGHYALLFLPERDGPEPRAALHVVLIVHGAVGYAAAVLFGSLLGRHVPAGLLRRRKVISGLAAVVLIAGLLGSALLLYYASSEAMRDAASVAHQALGLVAIGVVSVHIASRAAPR